MLEVLIYGLGWISLLSSLLGYDVSFINTLLISFFSYFVTISLFRNKKRGLLSVAVLCLLSGGIFFIMYILGNVNIIINTVNIFITPYFDSMTNKSSPIDVPRQIAAIFLISFFIYIIILKYRNKKYSNYTFIIVSLITLSVGFAQNYLSSMRDRYSFIFFVFCNMFYYFSIFYRKNIKKDSSNNKGSTPFIVIAIIYTIFIVGISQMLFHSFPYPFQAKPKRSTTHSISKSEALYKKFAFEVAKKGSISDKFQFEGIRLFTVKTQDTKYLKSIVYDTYKNNSWVQNDSLQQTNNKTFNTLKETGEVENVVVNYTNIQTSVLFAAPYIDNFDAHNPDIVIAYDENRGTYRIENYVSNIIEKDIIFSFDSLNVKSNTTLFKESLRKVNLQNTLPQYEVYDNEHIHELALNITKGIGTDYDKIEAIITYLKNNYTYNHTPSVSENDEADKIEYFLFESKEGFCQHYSSAAALLLRSINIPARYVTGFKIDTVIDFSSGPAYYKSLASGYKPVYDSDAHAWVEVYFKDYGWIMFESTGVDGMTVNENENLQKVKEVAEEKSKLSQQTINILIKIGLYLILPIMIALLIYMIINIRKSKNNFRKGSDTYKIKILYKIILGYLSASKLPKYSYETPQEYANRIDDINIDSKYLFSDLILAYNQIIYGDYELDTDFVSKYFVYLNHIKKELKKHCRLYRRVKLYIKEFIHT